MEEAAAVTAAVEAAAAVAAVDNDLLPTPETWAPTASHVVSTPWEQTTTAQRASKRRIIIRTAPHGASAWAATNFSSRPTESNPTTSATSATRTGPPPFDEGRG
jgi:hypothetical protein